MSLSTEETDGLFQEIDNLNSQLIATNQRYADLQAICDDQAKQLDILKEKLIAERMKYNLLFPEMWSKEDRRDAILQARDQLKAELPEVFQ
jgi:DNA gyrase/topoisomerase IV subunit A